MPCRSSIATEMFRLNGITLQRNSKKLQAVLLILIYFIFLHRKDDQTDGVNKNRGAWIKCRGLYSEQEDIFCEGIVLLHDINFFNSAT